MNSKDPLNRSHVNQRELFDKFVRTAGGFTTEHVVGAAINLVVNALRQAHPTQRGALQSFDELAAKTRALLADHYDGTGSRQNIFPFHQIVEVPLLHKPGSKNG